MRRIYAIEAERDGYVFPVFVTGLHCGSTEYVSYPGPEKSLPGLRDRAPLRPLGWVTTRASGMLVFPVFVTGLHCGYIGESLSATTWTVFPVFVTGLHCGNAIHMMNDNTANVFPVFVTGLHCGFMAHALIRVRLPWSDYAASWITSLA